MYTIHFQVHNNSSFIILTEDHDRFIIAIYHNYIEKLLSFKKLHNTSKQYFPLIVLHTYKSTKSALDLTLRKRREDLLAIHQETGIAKRLTRNEQKQFSHAVLICKYGNSRNDIYKNG